MSMSSHEFSELERQVGQLRNEAAEAKTQISRLTSLLAQARDRITGLVTEAERLAAPPISFGTLVAGVSDGQADVYTGGRKLRVSLSGELDPATIQPGREVMINDSMNVVEVLGTDQVGEVARLKEVMPDGERAVVTGHGDEDLVVRLADHLTALKLRPGDPLLVDRRVHFAYEQVPKLEVEDLVLEEVPDIGFDAIGGLRTQLEAIRDAVELPFLHPDVFAEYQLKAPKGILLYGPPGCGKTMIAKAVARSLAEQVTKRAGADEAETVSNEPRSFFINIKGPELLNKFVGETERQIRTVFSKARDKASHGVPVIVFFDEMESLFRTRGTGVSSDVENTIVPQLLSEIDGVEGLDNVIIIGASNREDMIDPAILRPGRLDVKIKIERPDAESSKDIFAKYLVPELPLHSADLAEFDGDRDRCVSAMIDAVVERMYSTTDEFQFLEVTYAGGDKEVLYFKDFNSGAMIGNIVDRAKKLAIKDWLTVGERGIRVDHLLQSCVEEFSENEDLPNTTNPDDWAKISGRKGERIVFIRTLISSKTAGAASRSIDTVTNTGQYL